MALPVPAPGAVTLLRGARPAVAVDFSAFAADVLAAALAAVAAGREAPSVVEILGVWVVVREAMATILRWYVDVRESILFELWPKNITKI
ncbi:MAG: hypothetical protein MZV65_44490 [Chromatiales bacterium]|nr:hypothetical protein [Chromatiales bacterium]